MNRVIANFLDLNTETNCRNKYAEKVNHTQNLPSFGNPCLLLHSQISIRIKQYPAYKQSTRLANPFAPTHKHSHRLAHPAPPIEFRLLANTAPAYRALQTRTPCSLN